MYDVTFVPLPGETRPRVYAKCGRCGAVVPMGTMRAGLCNNCRGVRRGTAPRKARKRPPVAINEAKAARLRERLPEIRCKFDENVAAFIVQHLLPGKDWMWRRHEFTEAAFAGFRTLQRLDLAAFWHIAQFYVVVPEMFSLDLAEIALEAAGYTVTPAGDGGFWLRRYERQVQYYRRRGMAVRRALREIERTGRF
jgi:hypothetical protein